MPKMAAFFVSRTETNRNISFVFVLVFLELYIRKFFLQYSLIPCLCNEGILLMSNLRQQS